MKRILLVVSLCASLVLTAAPIKSGIGARETSSINGEAKLPYDAVVEYIQTRGQQWIDTGYVPTSFPNLELRGACPYSTTIVFGMYSPVNAFVVGVRNINSSDGQIWWYDGKDSRVVKNTKYEPHLEFRLYTNGDKFVVGPHSTDSFIVDLSSNKQSIRLNTARWSSYNSSSDTKIKWFKIWDGEELVLDLVPVRFTNSAGETDGGLYDRVSGRLLKNQGTGTFVVGPDVVEE